MAAAVAGTPVLLAPGSRTNSTITAPSGITNGELLVYVLLTGRNPPVTPTPPSGFAHVTGSPWTMTSHGGDPYVVRVSVMTKVASGESGNYTATHAAADSEGIIFRASGVANPAITVTPVVTDHPSGSGGGTVTAPTVTTTVNDSLIVWWGSCWDGFGATSPSAGTTPTFTERANNTSGVFYCQTGVLATAGATGAKSVTASQPDGRPWMAGMVVFDADVGGGGTPLRRYSLTTLGVG
jgi:hypothetical protein